MITNVMPPIHALLFDFGGTIDTNGQHWGKMLWQMYQQVGVPVCEDDFRKAYVYGERMLEKSPLVKPTDTLHRTIEVKLRLELEQLCMMGVWDVDEAELLHTRELLLSEIYQHVTQIIEQHRKMLQCLKERFPMGLVTNFYGNMNMVLQEFSLGDIFETVIESAAVNIRKPDVRIFKLALDALQLPAEEVLVIGDSFYKDVEPASKLGCQTAWLKGEGWIEKQYDETLPTYILTSLSEMVSIVDDASTTKR